MLNLLAISYENIGPFKDQKISIFFQQGNYLIKAPIGTGKSFLFFDGPSYALYKNANRNILNVQSKTGSIKLLFEANGQTFFIVRQLKQGKSRDSTSSQLFSITNSGTELLEKLKNWSLLSFGMDIGEELSKYQIPLEELTFKNESDLQQQLNELLPPQEVFVSTIFLLQDAQNIFEMQPAERLEVLKNVFGLLGIDESKELIKDKRNEIKYQIRAYQDTSRHEEKMKHYLQRLSTFFWALENNDLTTSQVDSAKEIFSELDSLKDKLSIQNFSLDKALFDFIAPVQEKLAQEQQKYQQKKTEFWVYQEQIQTFNTQIQSQDQQLSTLSRKLQSLETLLKGINPEFLGQLRKEKTTLINEQVKLENQAYTPQFQDFYTHYAQELELQERNNFSLRMNQQFVQELMTLGTTLKSKSELCEKQLENLKEKELLAKENAKVQLQTLQERQQFFEKQLAEIKQKIINFQDQMTSEETFSCSEIQGNCPFIRIIKQQHFEQREKEKKLMLNEKSALEAQIQHEDFAGKIAELTNTINTPQQNSTFQTEYQQLQAQKTKLQEQLSILRTFLQSIDYKKLGEHFQEQEKMNTELLALEKQIQEQENLLIHQEAYQQEKIQITSTISQIQEQKKALELQKSQLQEKIQLLQTELDQEPKMTFQQAETALQGYIQTFEALKQLIEDYQHIQLDLKKLGEQEKILNNLYTILNKELLLFVLSEYLPVLSDIINSYLSSVVNYQIAIKLKESSEKLELETKILDEKGEREVKSLSGGQKTILKLVWMLAISSYMKTEMLFLDETVNNLDAETVGKVAQLLESFVKQRAMKFYVITHNSEIQAMNIWNQTITLESNKK